MSYHFTRSKAVRPNVPDYYEDDVEPDDVAPAAATHHSSRSRISS